VIAFKPHLEAYVIPDEAVYLVSERGVAAVQGELATALAPLLDGTRAAEQIVGELADRYPPERIRRALDQLVRAGRVSETPATVTCDRHTAAYWELAGLDGHQAAGRIAAGHVQLDGHGEVDLGPFEQALATVGLVPTGSAPGPAPAAHALALVVCDDYLQPTLAEVNATALASERPWLLVRPVGSVIWVGPLFRPGQTGCWRCLEHRLSANRQALSYLQNRLGTQTPPVSAGRLALTVGLGAQLAALEAARFVAGVPAGEAAVLTFDTLSMTQERHTLVRRPQCPDCGDPTLVAGRGRRRIAFASRPKAFTGDGGHRALPPEEVLERYGDQVSPITGVVTNLTRFTAARPELKVYTAGQNLARHVDQLGLLRTSLRSLSCGKGMSDTQARASAICESIERYSGVFQGDEARITASFSKLGDDAIHPDRCLLYSEAQYRDRAAWNARGSAFNFVTDPLPDDARVEWSPVWSMTASRTRWLPTSYLYYGYPRHPGSGLPVADSNGSAAGTSLEDAALQGFLELVERDSVALWWYNRVRRPAIDLDSFADPYISRLRATYASLEREVWALDLTSDFGIPAVGAFSRRIGREVEDILIAFGAHLDPRIALLRALTEMNQFLPAVIHSERGLEMLVLDQTRPDIGLPVVKVIVPGMRHFWARLAPGRLYDVPVALGWLPEPTNESALNPIPVFI
jgi:ribosomal protein S12 methylthiotransferase accessory factor